MHDARYALRGLLRRPGFSLLAVLTLAVGIGVNTVAFSAVNGLLFKPFTFDAPQDLAWVMARDRKSPHGPVSWALYQDLAAGATGIELAAEGRIPLGWQSASGTEPVWSLLVSTNYFEVLRVRAGLGRVFTSAEGRDAFAAVVSHKFWQERLGGGSIAGRTITLNRQTFAIVGVLRDEFQGPGGLYAPEVWVPIERARELSLPSHLLSAEGAWLTLVGRLRTGRTPDQAQSELDILGRHLFPSDAGATGPLGLELHIMSGGHPDLKRMRPVLWIAMAIVGVVLLIACFNVASLLLARATERQRELATRTALGASRGRIVRLLVTEGALLAGLSGVAALVVALWSSRLLAAFSLPAPIPQRLHLGLDSRLALYTVGLVAIAAVLPALLPAWHATRHTVVRAIRNEAGASPRRSRARSAFVAAQIAGATVFLAAALLFLRSFWHTASIDSRFDAAHVLVMELSPSLSGYEANRSRVVANALIERLERLPGVRRAALADRVPFYVGFTSMVEYAAGTVDCGAAECPAAAIYAAGPGHLGALGIPIHAGRDFTAADLDGGRAILISARLAERIAQDGDALGRTLRIGPEGRTVEVVGIVADITHRHPTEQTPEVIYRPLESADFQRAFSVVVRTAGDPQALASAAREQLRALEPLLPVQGIMTMKERMAVPLWPSRTLAGFFLICGTLSLVLATGGLFGVTYYLVEQRTREFGVRLALGASRERIMSLVLGEGARVAAIGIVAGLAVAFAMAQFASRLLVGVTPGDPLTYLAASGLQAAVALAACALPAWRATQQDPMAALRQDC